MTNTANTIDSAAVSFLCSAGFASTFLTWVAGSPQYGALSTVWQWTGIRTLIGCSLVAFLVAALIIWRMYRVTRRRPHSLLAFGIVSATPFALFMTILAARFVHGE